MGVYEFYNQFHNFGFSPSYIFHLQELYRAVKHTNRHIDVRSTISNNSTNVATPNLLSPPPYRHTLLVTFFGGGGVEKEGIMLGLFNNSWTEINKIKIRRTISTVTKKKVWRSSNLNKKWKKKVADSTLNLTEDQFITVGI